ncbi:MAG: WG repeat-containing protein [Bacteroidaceae bacterium]|nr:WG repeat-containing protein [Bacteroidaceae bacterium]
MYKDLHGNDICGFRPMNREIMDGYARRMEDFCNIPTDEREKIRDEYLLYEDINSCFEIVEQDGKYGVLQRVLGEMVVPAVYEDIVPQPAVFHSGVQIYQARLNGKYGMVLADCKGSVVFPFICDKIILCDEFSDLYIFEREGGKGLMTLAYGKAMVLVDSVYDKVVPCIGTPFVQLFKNGKMGLWGSVLFIPAIYDDICIPLYVGWIKVRSKNRWGYIDKDNSFTENIDEAFLYYSNMPNVF